VRADKVIGCDVRRSPETPDLRYIDLSTPAMLSRIVVEEGVDWIFHNASILSAVGEKNPDLAMRVNVDALNTVFQVARQLSTDKHKIRLMVPSSISAFGPTTPLDNTPNETIQHPTTIYGVSKVYAELMGSYFHKVNAFNFRR
jgi:threonine 3-dehydrogenase